MKRLILHPKADATNSGFTFIELMIILAVLTITLTLAIPRYSIYSTRAKINDSLAVATPAKASIVYACNEDPSLTYLTNYVARYHFKATEYVFNIEISGNCSAPKIKVTTRDTGAQPDPVLTITGEYDDDIEVMTWHCVSNGLNAHLPATCRS